MAISKPKIARGSSYMRRTTIAIAASLALGAAGISLARDLGVQGRVWQIIEIDIRDLMIQSASKADPDKLRDELKQSAERYLENLPKRTLQSASRTATRWIDPSFTLNSDIQAPIQDANGEWQWSILHKKGTRFNPLTLQKPRNAMFYFSATSAEEAAFALALSRKYPGKVLLVESSGVNPDKLSVKFGEPVFSAKQQQLDRFQIDTTPSLLYAGEGEHDLYLGLTEFAPPFSIAQVEQVWPSISKGVIGEPK